MPVSLTQVVLVLALAVALGFVWSQAGRGRWRSLVGDRFLYGIPWGTLLTIAVVVTFYALAQSGLRHWSDPLMLPFVSWSHYYPTGLFTAGIAHSSPAHLVSNMAGVLALGPIAEYAWSHYPPSTRATDSSESESTHDRPPSREWLTRPWIRALVVFPTVWLTIAFGTALFSMGPGLGFSGAVFAIAGFAVVQYPLSTIFGVVTSIALQTIYRALTQPTVRETLEPGAPGPPGWAGIGFQAHMLGFLLGVLLAIALLWRRGRRPATERVFFGTLLFGLVQSLWLVAWSSGDEFVLYRGVGVAIVCILAVLVTIAATGSDQPTSFLPRVPTRRQAVIGWLGLVTVVFAIGVGSAMASDVSLILTLVPAGLLSILLALPALPSMVAGRTHSRSMSRRQAAIACLIGVTVLVAVPGVLFGMTTVGDDTVPGSGGVEVGDYTVTYEENATSGQTFAFAGETTANATKHSGVIVVSSDRELWIPEVREEVLEHDGNATVEVGGLGWRETITVTRSGWDVLGNETAYVVDLERDGETTRSFGSDPVRANTQLDGHSIEIVSSEPAFEIRVTEDGDHIGNATIPSVNETTTVGPLRFSIEADGGDDHRLITETNGTSVQIAERETY